MIFIHTVSNTNYHEPKCQHADNEHFRKEVIFKGYALGKGAHTSMLKVEEKGEKQ